VTGSDGVVRIPSGEQGMNLRLLHFRAIRSSRATAIFLVCCLSTLAQAQVGVHFKNFRDATFRVETIALPAVTAAASQFIFRPAGFGTGAEGYGYHYGVSLADNVNGKVMRKFVFAAASGHLDHYKAMEKGIIFRRILNATGHTIFVDPQSENKSFNWSGLPASLASAALSNGYQPSEQRTWSATLQRVGSNSAGYLIGDMFAEFRSAGCAVPLLHRLLGCK
jgi:hypothetical protein